MRAPVPSDTAGLDEMSTGKVDNTAVLNGGARGNPTWLIIRFSDVRHIIML